MSCFTVLGASGFIGSHLAHALAQAGHEVIAPGRHEPTPEGNLGHVIYAIGVTADFRRRPFDTMTAHVCRLNEVLRSGQFESLLYLSTTRVYQGLSGLVDENTPLVVDPQRPGDLYNLSKLAGESLALHCGRPAKVVRISNVYGAADRSENFLPSVLREVAAQRSVTLRTTPDSAKDYISLADVVSLLPRIATAGRQRVYNLCSGVNVSNAQLAARLQELTGSRIKYAPDAIESVFPPLCNARVREEFGFQPASLLDELPALVTHAGSRSEALAC